MSRMGTTTDGVGTQKTSGITNRSAREKTEQPAAKRKQRDPKQAGTQLVAGIRIAAAGSTKLGVNRLN
jgi:hypothetical protein